MDRGYRHCEREAAMKYLMLFCGTDEDAREFAALSPEELKERYGQVGRWFAENTSRIGATGQLQGPDTATSVRFGLDGAVVVTDGPFLEGKEQIGGYAEIEVADLDEALEMARTWPGRGTVEIRPAVPAR
jgi:hypothetical protein